MRLHCSQAMCKAIVPWPVGDPPRWPVRCPACHVMLYPRDRLRAAREEGIVDDIAVILIDGADGLDELDEEALRARIDAARAFTDALESAEPAPEAADEEDPGPPLAAPSQLDELAGDASDAERDERP